MHADSLCAVHHFPYCGRGRECWHCNNWIKDTHFLPVLLSLWILFMLGAGLLHQLPLPHSLWVCLGSQGVLTERADGEYQYLKMYLCLNLKTHTEKYMFFLPFSLSPDTFAVTKEMLPAHGNKYAGFSREENYATEACGWHDTRTSQKVLCGRMQLASFRVFCKAAEVPCAWSNKHLTCTVVVGEGGLYWFIINHSKMRLLCCYITLARGFLAKLFSVIFCFFSTTILLPHPRIH